MIRVFDLFSGIGGMRKGLEDTGKYETIAHCEIDTYARKVYNNNFDKVIEYDDVRTIVPNELPDFELLTAGFPCQSFSYAGHRMGFNDTRGTMFFEIARIAKEKRPETLLLENVKGLLNHDRGRTFITIINTLYELGYDVEWQVINGKYFVPQNRERVFIIGHSGKGSSRKVFPIINCNQVYDETCSETQREGERFRSSFISSRTIDANYWKGGGSRTMILTAFTKANVKNRIQDREETWAIDTCGHKQAVVVDDVKSIQKCGDRDKNNYSIKDDAHCLTANPMSDYQPKVVTGNSKIRKLTPLECERLMGFPDGWTKIEGISDTQRYKMLGNSVIPKIVEIIGKTLY